MRSVPIHEVVSCRPTGVDNRIEAGADSRGDTACHRICRRAAVDTIRRFIGKDPTGGHRTKRRSLGPITQKRKETLGAQAASGAPFLIRYHRAIGRRHTARSRTAASTVLASRSYRQEHDDIASRRGQKIFPSFLRSPPLSSPPCGLNRSAMGCRPNGLTVSIATGMPDAAVKLTTIWNHYQ